MIRGFANNQEQEHQLYHDDSLKQMCLSWWAFYRITPASLTCCRVKIHKSMFRWSCFLVIRTYWRIKGKKFRCYFNSTKIGFNTSDMKKPSNRTVYERKLLASKLLRVKERDIQVWVYPPMKFKHHTPESETEQRKTYGYVSSYRPARITTGTNLSL